MGGIKLQLLCGVRIELAVGSLPYLARETVQVPPHTLWRYLVYLQREKGCYKHTIPFRLEVESLHRDNPSLVWGLNKQNKTNSQSDIVKCRITSIYYAPSN